MRNGKEEGAGLLLQRVITLITGELRGDSMRARDCIFFPSFFRRLRVVLIPNEGRILYSLYYLEIFHA